MEILPDIEGLCRCDRFEAKKYPGGKCEQMRFPFENYEDFQITLQN